MPKSRRNRRSKPKRRQSVLGRAAELRTREANSSDVINGPQKPWPSADMRHPVLVRNFTEIDHIGANAFLMALAAWQRGLKVTFHYSFAQSKRFSRLPVTGYRGELFSVSDGQKRHDFFRTLGDLTSYEASVLCGSKPDTKVLLKQAGIDVPTGVVVNPGQISEAEDYLSQNPDQRFLLKPVAGSLQRGVFRNLSAQAVRQLLTASREPMLLEEFVRGIEYRVHVVGDRVILALKKRPASVEGDGAHSIAQLVTKKALLRRQHPVYRSRPFLLDEAAIAFLTNQGWAEDDIPAPGQRVYLSDVPGSDLGGESVDSTDVLPSLAREFAIRTVRTLAVPYAGIDIIVVDSNICADKPLRVVVLEANSNPFITHTAVPLTGALESPHNRVAEAIIDYYFPESVASRRHVKAGFDFMQICRILRSGTVGEVALPVLGHNWVHRNFRIAATEINERTEPRIRDGMLIWGIHAQLIKNYVGDLVVDLVAPEDRYTDFLRALTGQQEH